MGLSLVARCSGGHHCHHMQSSIKMDAAWSHQHNGFHVSWRYGGEGEMAGGTEKISADHFFCFCSRLCRHLDPVSLQRMLPRREDYSSSKCKINTSEVTDAPSSQAERRGSGFPASEAARTEERDFVHSRRAALSVWWRGERGRHIGGWWALNLQERWCCITYVHDCVQPLVLCFFF